VRYDVFVTVWGKSFVDKFIDLSLRSQLAEGNLPTVSNDAKIHYHIYTDRVSHKYFSAGVEELSEFAEVHFYFFDQIMYGNGNLEEAIENSDFATVKHNVQRITSSHMLSRLEDSAAILLDSDFIVADGTLAQMHKLRRQGKRAVMAPLLRLNAESATTLLHRNLSFYLEARNLVRLCLEEMHPIFEAYFMGTKRSTVYPSQVNWWVHNFSGKEKVRTGVITQCLFPHPLMIEPDLLTAESGIKYFSTMDYDYVFRAVADDRAIHLSRDSDEILLCKVSPTGYRANSAKTGPLSVERMAHFIVNNTNIRHRLFLSQPVYFLANTVGNWEEVSQNAVHFVQAAYEAADAIVQKAPMTDPLTMVHLKSFLGPIEDFISPQIQSRMKDLFPR